MTVKVRLALVSVGELFGGVETHLLGMCTWAQRQGHEPLLILYHDRELARQARRLGVVPIILAQAGRFDLTNPRRLAKILADKRITVVHAHGYRAMVNVALARWFYRFGVVRTVHGLSESRGFLSRGAMKERIYLLLERVASKFSHAHTCYVTRDLQTDRRGRNTGTTSVVYNGIEPMDPAAYDRPADLAPSTYSFAAVGRVSRIKGLSFALSAMKKLDPALDVTLYIIGTGVLCEELGQEAMAMGLGDRVRFLGFKRNIYDYLAHIDCLIMPSLHEGLPYTILEAMSLGIPILASRVGGLSEVLDHEQNALLFEVGDVQEMVRQMELMVRDPALGKRLGAAAQLKQHRELTLDQMGSAYWSIYESLGG